MSFEGLSVQELILQLQQERIRAEAEKQRAEAEKQERIRAEAEKQRAEAEKQRAEAEKQRAEAEKQHAEERIRQVEAHAEERIRQVETENISLAWAGVCQQAASVHVSQPSTSATSSKLITKRSYIRPHVKIEPPKSGQAFKPRAEYSWKQGPVRELSHVHPPVAEFFQDVLKSTENLPLHLYVELYDRVGGHQIRRPDLAVIKHEALIEREANPELEAQPEIQEIPGSPQNAATARATLRTCFKKHGLLFVELKKDFHQSEDEALNQLARDAAEFSLYNFGSYSYGLYGDREHFQVLRMSPDYPAGHILTEFGPSFDVSFREPTTLQEMGDFLVDLLTWLCAGFEQCPRLQFPQFAPPLDNCKPQVILAARPQRLVLAATEGTEPVAVKLLFPPFASRNQNEMQNARLDLLRACPHLARWEVIELPQMTALVIRPLGSPLDQLCLCTGLKVRQYAPQLVRHISAALHFLHEASLAFVDLHPGNIIYDREESTFHLIDGEAISTIGEPCPVVLFRDYFAPRGWPKLDSVTPTADTDLESFVYCVAWTLDVSRIRTRSLQGGALASDSFKDQILAKVGHVDPLAYENGVFVRPHTLVLQQTAQ